MSKKQNWFLVATAATVGLIAGAFGGDVVLSDAFAGRNEMREHNFRANAIPAVIMTRIETYLEDTVCPEVDALYGEGVCDYSTVPFSIKLIRNATGEKRVVGKIRDLPVFVTVRPPAPTPTPEP